jgi:thioredoxin reductase
LEEIDDNKNILTSYNTMQLLLTEVVNPVMLRIKDVQDKTYRQAVTAAGSGCMAALDAERYLGEKGLH